MRIFKILTVLIAAFFTITLVGCCCGGVGDTIGDVVEEVIEEKIEEETGEEFEMGESEYSDSGNLSIQDLPPDFPSDLVYPGMNIESVMNIMTTTGIEGDSHDSSDKIISYYRSKMTSSGWQEMGYNTTSEETSIIYIKNGGQEHVTIAVIDSDKSGYNSHVIITRSVTPQ